MRLDIILAACEWFALVSLSALILYKLTDLVENIVAGPEKITAPLVRILAIVRLFLMAVLIGTPLVWLVRSLMVDLKYGVVPAITLLAVLTATAIYLKTGGKERIMQGFRRGSPGPHPSKS